MSIKCQFRFEFLFIMVFSQLHKRFIIESYFRNGNLENGEWIYSTRPCLVEFRQQFPDLVFLEADFFNVVRNCVRLFRETGSVTHKDGGGRPTVRTEETIENVREIMNEAPTTSLRRLTQQVPVSYGTCRTILRKDIGLFPYKMQAYHELLPPDHNRRVLYCQWFTQHLLHNNDLLDLTFFTDEAWFHLSGYINSQTMRMWSAENPHIFRESPLHSQKVGVWIGVSRRRLIPIFFEGTINAQRYRDNILEPFINQLHEDELQQGYFQNDGATSHTTPQSIAYLRQFFDDRLISLRCVPEFPPRSPDLTILDYFVFPHLKNIIFKTPVHTLPELRNRIVEECANITPEMLRNAFENMKRRVNLCLHENGGHFQHLM